MSTKKLSPYLCVFAFLFLLAKNAPAENDAVFRLHFLDVGYGDSILIESASFVVLIDAGEKKYASRLLDYLHSRGIDKLDAVIITHPHKNHFEGFLQLLEKIKIKSLFINGEPRSEAGYSELLSAFRQKNIPIKILKAGSQIDTPVNDLTIKVLQPNDLSADPNGNSLVTWLRFRETYFLLTADIGDKQEKWLIEKKPFIKKAHVVQIPHHGGSVSDEWTSFFEHPLFVISTGANPWGIPDEEALRKLNGPVWRTDLHGTIVVESDGRKLKVLPSKHKK